MKDDISNTSINLGVVSMDGDDINVTLDMRFPVKSNTEAVTKLLDISDDNNKVIINSKVEPLYFDVNSPMIQALHKAYVDITGDTTNQMEAIGGGTYAKAIKNIIAFGSEFPGEENHIHDVNEQMNLDYFKKQVEIYIEAIKNLNEIED
ncbi:MAG: M20/M25/M40 family metallo-hydrolase [Erysipelotrichaceae bacterium]|nr:M20/M25/M40 family metallo-hydrolase [Erysipelotrichaceae bacterium]